MARIKFLKCQRMTALDRCKKGFECWACSTKKKLMKLLKQRGLISPDGSKSQAKPEIIKED